MRLLSLPNIAEQTGRLLGGIDNLQQLEELGDQLLLRQDGEDWLGAMRKAGPDDTR